jgi:hypothetical protein
VQERRSLPQGHLFKEVRDATPSAEDHDAAMYMAACRRRDVGIDHWVSLLITGSAWGESALSIYQATLMEPGQKAPEVSTEEFSAQTLPGARNLPLSAVKPGKDVGEVKAAKDDGRLPMEDHNTRLLWM